MNHLANHPETPVVTVYLAIQNKNDLEDIRRIIEKNHRKPNVVMVKSPEIFQSFTGLLNLVEKHQDDGLVFAISVELRIVKTPL